MPNTIEATYFTRRAAESRLASSNASSGCARIIHAKLASAYEIKLATLTALRPETATAGKSTLSPSLPSS